MHIGILSDPNNFHTQKWGTALQNAGAEVTVFSFESTPEPLSSGSSLVHQVIKKSFPHSHFPTFPLRYLSYLGSGKSLQEALISHKIDVLNSLNVTPFGVLARKSGFRPHIVSAIGADILEYPPRLSEIPGLESRSWANIQGRKGFQEGLKANFLRKFYRREVAKTLEQADLICPDNHFLANRIHKWFNIPAKKIRILPWGIEPDLFLPRPDVLRSVKQLLGINLSSNQRVILSPRGAKAIYQADIIFEAFRSLVKSQRYPHKFVMLSAGYEISPFLEREATALETEFPHHFQFVRRVLPREWIHALWNLVDIFVSAPIYDGYSAALAEGRYIGAIPIVNNIPANIEVISSGENGIVVDPFNSPTLQTNIENTLSQLDELKEMFAPRNRQWIEENSLVVNNAKIFLSLGKGLLNR